MLKQTNKNTVSAKNEFFGQRSLNGIQKKKAECGLKWWRKASWRKWDFRNAIQQWFGGGCISPDKLRDILKLSILKPSPSPCWANQNLWWLISTISQFNSVSQSCPTLCDPMNPSTPGLPVPHQLPEFTHTHVHRVGDAIQPSHLLSSPSPPALNLSQHQGLFQWVSSSNQVAKVLEFQLQHQSYQWTPRTDLL